jgi:DNA-binding transcriptional LysR family regulator
MNIRALLYIVEIAKARHITQAAQKLFITQPALHKMLRKLEEELGTSLFYRKGNELYPTDTGQIVLETAESIQALLSQMNDFIEATKNIKRGKVTIGFPSIVGTLYLPELFIQFQQKYPDISLCTMEAGGIELSKFVSSGDLDMAIIMRPVQSASLNEIPLIKDQVVASVNSFHPLAERSDITISDLNHIPFNTFDRTFNMHSQLMKRFADEGVTPTVAFVSASCHFLLEISTLSNQVLILPKPIVEFYTTGNVTTIPFNPTFPWELCLIFQKNSFLSNASKALIGHIQQYFLEIKN